MLTCLILQHLFLYLVGDSQYDISLQYGIGHSTVSEIVADTLEAIYLSLKDEYMVVSNNLFFPLIINLN